jgi:arginyl-tRNA synthetase
LILALNPLIFKQNEVKLRMMARKEIEKLINGAVRDLFGKELEIKIERPTETAFGDYATNVAMVFKKNPQEIVDALKSDIFEKIEVKNGFINFFLSKKYLQKQVGEILKEKGKFGQLKIGKGEKVNVEFISANPTGPLHIGNGRGGFCGDVLSNVLNAVGYKVTREYYINDMGRQIEVLKNSLEGREPSYKSSYIDELKKKGIKEPKKAIKFIQGKIEKTTEKMGIKFDKWFYESELYEKETNKVLAFLKKRDLIYEKEGALWFKSTQFGDDKDRVLKRAQRGEAYHEETYFLSDIAYLKNKIERGFKRLIMFLGAEHHGYIGRLKAAAEALGFNKNILEPIIMQFVHLVEGEKGIKMSKRTGTYVTVDELLDKVGIDVARFFFLMKSPGSHLFFNLDLAKQQSEKNPVYYVQYAHARICSILKRAKNLKPGIKKLELLNHPSELALIKQLIKLPEIVEDVSGDYQVQRLPQYAIDLAASFHQFYRDCRVISEKKELSQARLSLILAAKVVLKNTLDLIGVSAPEKM